MPSAQKANKKAVSAVGAEKVVPLHKVRSSWVLQLDSFILRSLIESNAAHIRPTQAQIDALNEATMTPISHAVFAERLKAAGIFLTSSQIKWANAENRQIHYRSRIENDVLRELAKAFRIHVSKWNKSAKKEIDFINELLHCPIEPAALGIALASIGIAASSDQLKAIIEESAACNEASPYRSARSNCEALQRAMSDLNVKTTQQQFSGYLSLIINESALSEISVDNLKAEILTIISTNDSATKVGNPYLASVKAIREQVEALYQRRAVLLEQRKLPERDQLVHQIDKLLSSVQSKSFQRLFKQQSALEKWASTNRMSDMMHREISQLASKHVLRNSQADRLYKKLHEKSIRTVIDSVHATLCQDAKEYSIQLDCYRAEVNALDVPNFDVAYFRNAITEAKTKPALEYIKSQLQAIPGLAELSKRKSALGETYASLGVRFLSFVGFYKMLYGNLKLSPKYKAPLDALNIGTNMKAGGDLTQDSSSSRKLLETNPGLSLDNFNTLRQHEALFKDIQNKMPIVPEVEIEPENKGLVEGVSIKVIPRPAHVEPIPATSVEQHSMLDTLGLNDAWGYAKDHPIKVLAGTLVGGAVFVTFLPYTVAAFAAFKIGGLAATALSAKFGVGAAVGAAATSVVGAKKSSWFSFFRQEEEASAEVDASVKDSAQRFNN